MNEKITEEFVVNQIIKFMMNKKMVIGMKKK